MVGVDSSGPGRAALAFAARQAAATGCRLELVHVIDFEAEAVLGARGADALRRSGLQLLEAAEGQVRALDLPVPVRTRLGSGNPMWELVAASVGAELVVVGTHKTGFIRGRVFGSRSLFLAAAARCPVAVVPLSDAAPRRGITIGFDASPASFAALRFAAATALATCAELTIIRALVSAGHHGESDAVRQHREQVQQRTAAAMLLVAESAARESAKELAIRTRIVRSSSAAEVLVGASAHAELLVLGAGREQEKTHYPALSPTGHDMLMNLLGPAVIVHSADR